MASSINAAIPATGAAIASAPVRANFAAAKAEIEALQTALARVPGEGGVTLVTDTSLGGHRLIAATGSAGLVYAGCDVAATANHLLGMSLHAAAAGAEISLRRWGEIEESSWTWAPGLPVYLGLAGVPTQTLPPTAVFSLIVGFPTTPTRLFVAPREPVMFE